MYMTPAWALSEETDASIAICQNINTSLLINLSNPPATSAETKFRIERILKLNDIVVTWCYPTNQKVVLFLIQNKKVLIDAYLVYC